MPPNVVNRRTARARPGDVYIGRPGRWGNPFVVGRHGTRDQVIELYRRRLWTDLQEGRTSRRDLAALAGKRLVCWCAPAPCHGDVLAAAAAWAAGGGELATADWRPA
ncbi:MAG: DUF4326 domain-containing protein [Chromatiales bacterium]|nr:DUF4326 domain-containing protein [Chromatiales bacterium]